ASLLLKSGHPAEAAEFLDALVKAEPWNTGARVKLAQAHIKAGQDAPGARAALLAIARSPMDVPYTIRLTAATAAAPTAERIWGSNELRLIGSGAAISPADADHPFFFEARLKAAAASPADRIRLLRAALEDFPDRDAARMALFRAALDARQDHLAVAALGRTAAILSNALKQEEPIETARYTTDDEAQVYAASMPIPDAERLPIAVGVATAFERLDRLPEALGYLRIAASLESTAEKKSALQKQIADLRARIRRREQNEARRPIIHPALEQDRVVRPMLVARTAPSPAPSARRTP
ncbi:MAG TPA: tetratricopeptide repeat protein, partial [Terriglobales bacterium]|nr:tetratricopeptide repeat protein [Terriglobales bacterium]